MLFKLIKREQYRNSPMSEFTIKQLREYCNILNQYCLTYLGVKKSKGLPTFSIRKRNDSTYLGQYCPGEHKIFIYYNNIKTLEEFVGIYIHEYTHSTQNLRHYMNRLRRYGYRQHPDEIEARDKEQNYKLSAFNFLIDNI